MSDKTEEKKTYRLFAMPLTDEAIRIATSERFSRATPTPEPGYVLVYTEREQPSNSAEITPDKENLLSNSDIRWLAESGATIIAEEIAKQPNLVETLSDRIAALETELRQRKKQLIQERGGDSNA